MKYVINKILFALFSFSLVVALVPSLLAETITLTEISPDNEDTETVQFVDVSVGASEKDSSCIFKVNGKTVVVDWHETEVVDGITIFVKNIYPVNTAAADQDKCEFLYSSSLSSKKESALKKTQIGDKLLTFFLGTRTEASAAEETDAEEIETGFHETPETARVLVDGYDVTADSSDATGEAVAVVEETKQTETANLVTETTAAPEEPAETEENGFFSKFFGWILGNE